MAPGAHPGDDEPTGRTKIRSGATALARPVVVLVVAYCAFLANLYVGVVGGIPVLSFLLFVSPSFAAVVVLRSVAKRRAHSELGSWVGALLLYFGAGFVLSLVVQIAEPGAFNAVSSNVVVIAWPSVVPWHVLTGCPC